MSDQAVVVPDTLRQVAGRIRAECFMVCDGAHAVEGKLYILGGGWDRLILSNFGQEQVINLVLKLLIPWMDTNQRLPFKLDIVDENGIPALPEPIGGQLEVGRPSGYTADEAIPFMVPIGVKLLFDRPKRLIFTLYVNDAEVASTSLRAIPPPGARLA